MRSRSARPPAANGTPLYATDLATLDAACAAVREAFPDPIVRQYSVKANDLPSIIGEVAARGYGANVVSRGEWALARRAGLPNARIALKGVGKTPADLRAAARAAAASFSSRYNGRPRTPHVFIDPGMPDVPSLPRFEPAAVIVRRRRARHDLGVQP